MKIEITNAQCAPEWTTLESLIRESLNDEKATVIRIARRDGGCNYSEPAEYDLEVRQCNGVPLNVELLISGQSKRKAHNTMLSVCFTVDHTCNPNKLTPDAILDGLQRRIDYLRSHSPEVTEAVEMLETVEVLV